MADDKPAEETQGETKKKGGKMLWIVIGAVVLGAAGGGAYFMMGGDDQPAEANLAPVEEPAQLVGMDTFLVNLNDVSGSRFMKVTLSLTVSPQAEADRVDTDELLRAKLRDRILSLLTSKTFDELVNPLGKESLRREIQVELDPMVENGQVRDVLFSEFVVQ